MCLFSFELAGFKNGDRLLMTGPHECAKKEKEIISFSEKSERVVLSRDASFKSLL